MEFSLNVLDLCSGIGGFSIGLERAGMRTVAFCEIDPYARKVLKKHWPDVPIYEDIKELTGERIRNEIGSIDVVTAGFPCQPYSIAGKRRGKEDDRDLWDEVLRVVQEVGSNWFIGENVVGFKDLGLEGCLDGLEGSGFEAQAFDIPACGYGLPTLERHIWIVAAASSLRLEGSWLLKIKELEEQGEFSGSHQRFNNGWDLSKPRVCGVGEGLPNRSHRLRLLGNAVDPIFPQLIAEAIMHVE